MHTATQIEVNAPAQRVWEVLTDLSSYSQWNSFMPDAYGDVQVGRKIEVHVLPPGATGMIFVPRVLVADRPRELKWEASFMVRGLFDTVCTFTIEPLADDRVLVKHCETYSGILVPLIRASIRKHTARGFENMSRELKERAEANPSW